MKQVLELFKKHRLILLAWAVLVLISSCLKVGFVVGSEQASLSLLGATLPVLAYFFPMHLALPVVVSAWMLTHMSWPVPLTMGIPTMLATLSWTASQKSRVWQDGVMHVILPLACMALFCASPVGAGAWPYSLYWLVPVVLYFIPLGIVGRALKSTFVAHAVGSVIWVYLIPMSPISWLALIPVVALERLLMASWSIVMIGALAYVKMEFWKSHQAEVAQAADKAL